jgi:hypothetical protein
MRKIGSFDLNKKYINICYSLLSDKSNHINGYKPRLAIISGKKRLIPKLGVDGVVYFMGQNS